MFYKFIYKTKLKENNINLFTHPQHARLLTHDSVQCLTRGKRDIRWVFTNTFPPL